VFSREAAGPWSNSELNISQCREEKQATARDRNTDPRKQQNTHLVRMQAALRNLFTTTIKLAACRSPVKTRRWVVNN